MDKKIFDSNLHEEFFQQEVLPKQLVTYGCGIVRPFHLWCIGCEANEVLAYVELLGTFRKSIPRFRYRLLVSDCDSPRMRMTRTQLEESGKLFRSGADVKFKLEFLEMWNISVRKTQDVIVLGQKMSDLTCGSPSAVLGDLCGLLFPGRYLLGREDLLEHCGWLPLVKVDRFVFQRTELAEVVGKRCEAGQ